MFAYPYRLLLHRATGYILSWMHGARSIGLTVYARRGSKHLAARSDLQSRRERSVTVAAFRSRSTTAPGARPDLQTLRNCRESGRDSQEAEHRGTSPIPVQNAPCPRYRSVLPGGRWQCVDTHFFVDACTVRHRQIANLLQSTEHAMALSFIRPAVEWATGGGTSTSYLGEKYVL